MITQEELKSALDYNPISGIFTWRTTVVKGRVEAGDVAGSWTAKRYWQIRVNGKLYMAHRLVWLYVYGVHPKGQIDHIDRNKSNNAISNLRVCSQNENQKNVKIRADNTSGFKGVHPFGNTGKFVAQITLNGEQTYLGVFTTKEEASLVYEDAAKQHHGEFYRDTTQSCNLLP